MASAEWPTLSNAAVASFPSKAQQMILSHVQFTDENSLTVLYEIFQKQSVASHDREIWKLSTVHRRYMHIKAFT